ncbi:MAG: prepilin-type N-terminal cleavage/methylation domain-containing protein [Gammaproteobacteria bacterium]
MKLAMLKRNQGFTLVELLIVAIILAILAAIVLPQFSATTRDAEEAALRANLATLRNAVELYRQQHGEYPAVSASSGGVCTGTAGTGALETQLAIQDQLTRYTSANGQSCSLPDAGAFAFGPYLREDNFPENPVTKSNVVTIVGAAAPSAGDLNMAGDGPAVGGWKYDVLSGKFIANDTNLDAAGVSYDSY